MKNLLEKVAELQAEYRKNRQSREQVDYDVYLKSLAWADIRRKQLHNQKICQACGSTENLHVHHMTYRRLGSERLKNLKTLCQPCHFLLHDLFREIRAKFGWRRDDLLKFTRSFCKARRKELGVTL